MEITDEMVLRAAHAIRKTLTEIEPDRDWNSLDEPIDEKELVLCRAALDAALNPST